MPATFKLSPDVSDQNLSITIPKELKPYTDAWFADEGSGTIEEWVIATLCDVSMRHRLRKLTEDCNVVHDAAKEVDRAAVETDYLSEKAAIC